MWPDFTAYDVEGVFNAELFFNWIEIRKLNNIMPYVREAENHGIGGLNVGSYCQSPNFTMAIRCGAETEEQVMAVIAKIPNFTTHFHHVIIGPLESYK